MNDMKQAANEIEPDGSNYASVDGQNTPMSLQEPHHVFVSAVHGDG